MKTLHLFFLVSLNSAALIAATTANSTSTKFTVYGAWLSTNGDCSSPVAIASNSAGTVTDINKSPTLATGAIAPATYKCLILKVDSLITFTPDTGAPAPCVVGTPVTQKICAANGLTGSANTVHTSKDALTGATISCTGSNGDTTGGQQVYIYLSTNAACNGGTAGGCTFPNVFQPPTAAGDIANGWKLVSPIVVSANTTASLIFNTDNQVDSRSGFCNLEGFILDYK